MQNRNTFSWIKEQMTRSISLLIVIYVITRTSISNAYLAQDSRMYQFNLGMNRQNLLIILHPLLFSFGKTVEKDYPAVSN